MLRTIAKIWPLFFALSLLMIGNGLQGSLLGLRAGVEGFTTTVIGLLMSFYYAGFVASSFLTPRLVKEAGHIRVFAAFASVVSSIVLLHAVFVDTLLWIILRFIGGFAIAGLYVVVESWLNDIASNKTRGRLFGMYIINTHMCLGLGQLSLTIVDPSDVNSFIFVAILVSLSVVPISLGKGSQPMVEQVESMSIISLYQKAPLGLIACLFVGMAQSAFMSMGAVYGTAIGLSTSQIGFLFSLPLLSVVIAQLPIGILSDYFDRRLMLALLSFVVAFCGGIAAMINPTEFVLLMALFTVYGSLSVPLYSLAVAHANDVLPSSQML
ncbi:MAG: MFS transporter, partial [Alphaproteobacteria bacterium]|nr:MFS transporter [Alphaproteobacteria bacterium]